MIKFTALLAASALTLAACGGNSNSSSSKTSTTSTSAASAASTSSGGGQQLQLMDNFFQPKAITGKAGSTVTINLKNAGAAEHTFTIDSQKINKTLTPGSSATVSVKIPASGSVQFYCMFHRSLGMVGTIKAS
jgi:plastocyanin